MGDVSEVDKSLPRIYEVTIHNFSMIKNTMEIYESAVFEAGHYKWKLVVRPNGNKSKKVKDHLSCYLALAERVALGSEVNVDFRLYLKPNSDQFPGLDLGKQQRLFHPLKLEHGFDKLSGGLEGDCYIFGVEILSAVPAKTKGKAECLTMSEEPPVITHTWRIDKFPTKLNEECLSSETFRDRNIEWKIQLCPRKGTEMSVYLEFANPKSFGDSHRIYAEVTLRMVDESKGRHATHTGKFWFSGTSPKQGWIKVDNFVGLKKWCSVKDILFGESDVLLVQAKVKVLGTADAILP